MTKKIPIINNHPSLTISRLFLRNEIRKILRHLDLKGCGLELTFCDDPFMSGQNQKYMGKKGTTDVLSFPQIEPQKNRKYYQGKFLGDILISLDQAKRQATEQRLSLRKEVLFLILHSILHLIGYDHSEKGERCKMQTLESRVWKAL